MVSRIGSPQISVYLLFSIHSENCLSNVSIFSLLQHLQETKNNIFENDIIVDIRVLKLYYCRVEHLLVF